MGVYLSTPNTDKNSCDETCQKFTYGASSMQGWRMSQEDAHNCIPDFDVNTALFAVYDGHGGAEVAQYCATNLPQFIKETKAYKEGKYSEALEEAFLGFDALLTTPKAIKELKVLAGVESDDEESPAKKRSIQRTEAELLRQEADMPIEELVAKYETEESAQPRTRLLRKKVQVNSPVIKQKKLPFPKDTENEKLDLTENTNKEAEEGDKISNGHAENENNINLEKENQMSSSSSLTSSSVQQDTVSSSSKSSSDMIDSSDGSSSTVVQPESCGSSTSVKTEEASSSSSSGISSSCPAGSSIDVPGGSSHSSQSGSGSIDIEKSGVSSSDSKQTSVNSKETKHNEGETDQQECGSSGIKDGASSSSLPDSIGSSSSGSADMPSCSGSSGLGNSAGGSSSIADSCSGSSKMADSAGGSSEEVDSAGGSGEMDADDDDADYLAEEDEDFSGSEDEDVEFNSEDEEEEESEEEDEEEEEEIEAIEEDPHTEEPGSDSGSTAVVALIKDKEIFVANAGDSRCVLCRAGKAVELSFDHKPEDDIEKNRIHAAGGKVTEEGRVNGGLNLSRALGDHFYKRNTSKSAKEQMITALPDIETATLQETDEFLVLACDGIWNYMTNQEVVDFVKEKMKEEENRKKLSLICEQLFDKCLAPNTLGDGTGCDNMTCIIVTFDQIWNNNKNKRPAEETEQVSDKRRKTEELGT